MNRLETCWLVAVMVCTTPYGFGQLPQIENPVTCNPSGATLLAYGDHTSGCAISPATQIDIFTFLGTAGDLIRVAIDGTSNDFDPNLQILDPAGATFHLQTCSANSISTCSLVAEAGTGGLAPLPSTGFYTLIVSDAGSNNAGNYILGLERIVPPLGNPVVSYGLSSSDLLSPSVDVDWMSFNALAGDLITINLLTTTADLDLALRVYDPTGAVLVSGSCSANSISVCSFSIPPTAITVSGTYHLMFFEIGTDNVGGYQFSLQCLFGPSCATTSSSYPGTVEDLELATGINIVPTVFPDIKPATSGDTLRITLFSPMGGFTGRIPVLAGQVVPTGFVTTDAVYP
ncbi:MAG: PPC domain-containing protein, partial [Planctomycetes bacterium]|nr:PPC domain-containing protein [Planctomycetota bacterium]